jgi:hypothetical protein
MLQGSLFVGVVRIGYMRLVQFLLRDLSTPHTTMEFVRSTVLARCLEHVNDTPLVLRILSCKHPYVNFFWNVRMLTASQRQFGALWICLELFRQLGD